jgi:uncharacterized phage protein (TIGR02218 family)
MTFQTYETSEASGEPVVLYDFSLGTTHWRYTSADRSITWNGNAYAPLAISRTAPIQSSDIRQQMMTVTVPRNAPVAQPFVEYAPGADMLLIVTGLHYNDTDQQGVVDWVGRVISPEWKNSQCDLKCEPVYASVQTMGLRRRWGPNCSHVLYGPACTLSTAAFKVTASIDSVSGAAITSSGFIPPAGLNFLGGFVEWDSGLGYLERRTINGVVGTTLTLAYGSSRLAPGLSVNAYPGCDRSLNTCNLFGNSLNYGGEPFIPIKNPMDGSLANPVF